MPFTLAHPAAVLPFRQTLWFPGLVAGSMAPDLGYYVPIGVDGEFTHSIPGIPLDVVLSMVLAGLGLLTCRPLLALLGRTVTPRRPRILPAVTGILIGIATHLAWDAFTHTEGPAVRHWEFLRQSVIGPHRVYNVIGYLSSLGGLLVLGYYVLRWYRHAHPVAPPPHRFRVIAALVLLAALGAFAASFDPVTDVDLYDCVRHLLVGAIRSATTAFVLYAAVSTVLAEVRPPSPPAGEPDEASPHLS